MGMEIASPFPVVQCSVKADVAVISGCFSKGSSRRLQREQIPNTQGAVYPGRDGSSLKSLRTEKPAPLTLLPDTSHGDTLC